MERSDYTPWTPSQHTGTSLVVQSAQRIKHLSGGSMTKRDKPVRGIDWEAIFERRPDLKPPGYEETVAIMQQRKLSQTEASS